MFRVDELARRAGIPTTTVRLYRTKGLLPAPTMVGRTGYYDESHVARLALVGRLRAQGFSLAGIARMLEAPDLGALVGTGDPVVVEATELAARFPEGTLTPDLVRRAHELGLVEPTDDGRFRVPDPRFLETGAALARLGVPSDVILEEWEALVAHTDEIAARFVDVFERHLLDRDRPDEMAAVLGRLHRIAVEVLGAALDASIARIGGERLAELSPPASRPRGRAAPPRGGRGRR